MTDRFYISWDEFHQHCKKLTKILKTNGAFTKIVAVSRGGLLPAGVIAYELNIRNCETINMSSYDPHNVARPDDKIELHTTVTEVDEQTLIIDDLSDSGRTFRILRELYPQACFVSLYTKPQGASFCDFYAETVPDQWIVFPWDVE